MSAISANFCRLQESFAALYAAFEIPRVARWAIVVLLAIHTGLLAYSAYVHSPTLNEPGHLVAGLSHWKFGRFELYRVNPPLVRACPPYQRRRCLCWSDSKGLVRRKYSAALQA